MAEQPEVSDNDEGAGDLRGKLVGRLAVAGLLVALLLGVLAFFDHLANPPEEPEERVFAERVPVAPKKEMSQPVKPAENLPEPPVPEKAEPPSSRRLHRRSRPSRRPQQRRKSLRKNAPP